MLFHLNVTLNINAVLGQVVHLNATPGTATKKLRWHLHSLVSLLCVYSTGLSIPESQFYRSISSWKNIYDNTRFHINQALKNQGIAKKNGILLEILFTAPIALFAICLTE